MIVNVGWHGVQYTAEKGVEFLGQPSYECSSIMVYTLCKQVWKLKSYAVQLFPCHCKVPLSISGLSCKLFQWSKHSGHFHVEEVAPSIEMTLEYLKKQRWPCHVTSGLRF
ncbi:hypothetical protein SLA2020_282440 [Shorea laevis]